MLDDAKVCSRETPSGVSGQQATGAGRSHSKVTFPERTETPTHAHQCTHGSIWGCGKVAAAEPAAASAHLHNEAGRVCWSKAEHKQHRGVTTAVIKARFTPPPPRARPRAISRRITPVNQSQPLPATISSCGVISLQIDVWVARRS